MQNIRSLDSLAYYVFYSMRRFLVVLWTENSDGTLKNILEDDHDRTIQDQLEVSTHAAFRG